MKIDYNQICDSTFISKLGAIRVKCTLNECDEIFDQVDAEEFGLTNFNRLKEYGKRKED